MDPIGDVDDVWHGVADEDDTHTLVADTADGVEDIPGLHDAQGGRRFVQENDAFGPGYGACNSNGLLLAT